MVVRSIVLLRPPESHPVQRRLRSGTALFLIGGAQLAWLGALGYGLVRLIAVV